MRLAAHLRNGSVVEWECDDWGGDVENGQLVSYTVNHGNNRKKERLVHLNPSEVVAIVRIN